MSDAEQAGGGRPRGVNGDGEARDGRPRGGEPPAGDRRLEEALDDLAVHQAELAMQNEELRRSQAALEASHRRWRSLFNHAPLPCLTVDAEGLVDEVNEAAARRLGSPSALRRRALAGLAVPDAQPELARLLAEAWGRRVAGPAELRLQGAGEEVVAEVTMASVESTDGAQVLVVLRDLTERRRADDERQRLTGQVERLQRLDALGRLAGAVAHELNNVLAVVLTAGGAAAAARAGTPAEGELEPILAAARRGRELTRRLLGFARTTPATLASLDAAALAGEVALFARSLARGVSEVVVEVAPAAAGARVRGDPTQLHQALLNLGINALDALGDRGGRVAYRVELLEVGDDRMARAAGLTPGPHVALTVEDDGPGFAPQALHHAFEPFFTTKPPGEGTGLGLAMVYGVARDHHGTATVDSVPGHGARVRLLLPRWRGEEPLAPAPTPAPIPAPRGAGRLVLVVDDEAVLGRSLCRLLGSHGWRTEAVTSGPEALQRLRRAPAPDLVLLDLLMPGMSGLETLGGLRQLAPKVPVVLMSGYTEERVPAEVLAYSVQGFLAKPFELADLTALLERLGQRGGAGG